MSKVHGSPEEERREDSRVVHREPSRRMAGDGAKTHGRCEEVEYHPRCVMLRPNESRHISAFRAPVHLIIYK